LFHLKKAAIWAAFKAVGSDFPPKKKRLSVWEPNT